MFRPFGVGTSSAVILIEYSTKEILVNSRVCVCVRIKVCASVGKNASQINAMKQNTCYALNFEFLNKTP